jgi:alpha-beta hydrolase superfamily lysophospholipase
MSAQVETFAGRQVEIAMSVWQNPEARHIVILVHGYGEHLGRYEHVAQFLVQRGAVVAGPDHIGHGRSGGERVEVADYSLVVDDLHAVVERLKERHPDLPVVLVGHSMGGMIAARYAQLHRDELVGLVLSGPVLGTWSSVTDLLALQEIPHDPLDVSTLSRDPRVGEIYSEDELVWHGPFKRQTVEALDAALRTISAGPKLGDLPTLWLHGEDDQLVPLNETRAGIDTLGFTHLEEVIYPQARHEVFNETNKDEVLTKTAEFIDRATSPGDTNGAGVNASAASARRG